MSGPAAVAAHASAGRVEPTRLAARVVDASAAPGPDEALPIAAHGALRAGRNRLGGLEVELALDGGGPLAGIDLRVKNDSDREVYLQSVVVGLRWTGAPAASLRFLRHGWQSWSFSGARDLDGRGGPAFHASPWLRGMHHAVGAVPTDRSSWHESDLVTAIGVAPEGPCVLVGVLERGCAFGVVYAQRQGDAVALEAELWVDAVLAPGEERPLERLRIALGEDPVALLEDYAEAYGRLARARSARPFVAGWCSWYHFFHDLGEDDLRRNIEALASARDELPVEVVQIDDGYQRAVGDWLRTGDSFPSGLEAMAREIRDAGFTPGLWTAPFCAVAESELFQKHGDWMLRRGDGLFRGLLHPEWSADASVYVLDTSRDEVLSHLERSFAELVGLGFHYLKLDFLYVAAMRAEAADPHLGRAARLRRGLEALRAGAGEEAFLLGCGCPLGAAVGLVDAMRVGPDVAPRWLPEDLHAVPGLEPALPSTRSAVRNVLARSWMHRRLWLNDPDCLIARSQGSQLAPGERRTLAAAVALGGGVALFSDDVPALAPEDRALVRDTLALAREVDTAGLPGTASALDLLSGPIASGAVAETSDGGILALVNGGERPTQAADDLAAARREGGRLEPLLGSEAAAAGEQWIEPHGSAVYRVQRPLSLAVFCDFDGTFSVQDVGATLAVAHAAERRPAQWERFERGEITAWEYNMEILDGLPVPLETLEEFLESVELDPGATELLAWCAERGVPFRILSDGFDYNLNRLQQLHGVSFAYEANRLRYEAGVWRIAAGAPDPSCGCGTGTCKRGRIGEFRKRHPGVSTVHIGNGRVSDLCGAVAADLAFAKGSLATELAARDEPFESFETLRDVIPGLERLLQEGGRRRRSA